MRINLADFLDSGKKKVNSFLCPSSQAIFQMEKVFSAKTGQNPPFLLQMRHTTALRQWLALAVF